MSVCALWILCKLFLSVSVSGSVNQPLMDRISFSCKPVSLLFSSVAPSCVAVLVAVSPPVCACSSASVRRRTWRAVGCRRVGTSARAGRAPAPSPRRATSTPSPATPPAAPATAGSPDPSVYEVPSREPCRNVKDIKGIEERLHWWFKVAIPCDWERKTLKVH